MATMNSKKKAPRNTSMRRTVNHEGAVVHKLDNLEWLFSRVLGSFYGESTFYDKRSGEKEFKELMEKIKGVNERDKEYVLKIAHLGRATNFGKMIQYPLEVLVACYNIDMYKGQNFIDRKTMTNKLQYYTDKILRRALDVTEVVSSQIAMFNFEKFEHKPNKRKLDNERNRHVPLPMQMRKGLAMKLNQLDDFALSKGLSESREVTLADVIKLVRPNPELSKHLHREGFYQQILEGNVTLGNGKAQIKSAMSQAGQQPYNREKVRDVKESVYQGTIQNILVALVSLLESGIFNDSDVLSHVYTKFTNVKEVEKSKLLPRDFWSAHKALGKTNVGHHLTRAKLMDALTQAMDLAIANVDTIEGYSGILVDVSGSMDKAISSKSTVTAVETACLLGAIAYKKGYGDLFIFGDNCERADFSKSMPVLDMAKMLVNRMYSIGNGTNLRYALRCISSYANKNDIKYDNFLIISDNDCYGYNRDTNTLTFGERNWFATNRNLDADKHLTWMMENNIIGKVWINNLLANESVVANTNEFKKNLIAGFTEQYVNIINTYNCMGGAKDIRKVIDELYDRYC